MASRSAKTSTNVSHTKNAGPKNTYEDAVSTHYASTSQEAERLIDFPRIHPRSRTIYITRPDGAIKEAVNLPQKPLIVRSLIDGPHKADIPNDDKRHSHDGTANILLREREAVAELQDIRHERLLIEAAIVQSSSFNRRHQNEGAEEVLLPLERQGLSLISSEDLQSIVLPIEIDWVQDAPAAEVYEHVRKLDADIIALCSELAVLNDDLHLNRFHSYTNEFTEVLGYRVTLKEVSWTWQDHVEDSSDNEDPYTFVDDESDRSYDEKPPKKQIKKYRKGPVIRGQLQSRSSVKPINVKNTSKRKREDLYSVSESEDDHMNTSDLNGCQYKRKGKRASYAHLLSNSTNRPSNQGTALGQGTRSGFTALFALPKPSANDVSSRDLDSDDRELLGLSPTQSTNDPESDNETEAEADNSNVFEFDEWSGPRYYPLKDGSNRYFKTRKAYNQYTLRNGRDASRHTTSYLPIENTWLLEMIKKAPNATYTVWTAAFNEKFAGKIVEGCSEVRQTRSTTSIMANVSRLGLKKKAAEEVEVAKGGLVLGKDKTGA